MPAYSRDRADEISAALGSLPTGTPVSEVARRLLDLFTNGSIAPGTRLPPERQLAVTLGVGRSAVREALAALEILGIVDVRAGSGTYLRGSASDMLPQTLRWGLLIGEKNTAELLEMRSGMEIYVARLAAARHHADDIAAVGRQVERMKQHAADRDFAAFSEADLEFHRALGRAAGNELLLDLLHVLRSLLQVYADRAVHDTEDAIIAVREHEAVYHEVRDGNADAAASAMAQHMATATVRLMGEVTRAQDPSQQQH